MVEPKCYVLVRGRNAHPYVERCVQSIQSQSYTNLTVLFVDDASDYTKELQKKMNNLLKKDVVIWRKERFYSVRNAYELIHQYCKDPKGIVINLDADDWFSGPESVAQIVKFYQQQHCVLSYGECYIWTGNDETRLAKSTQVMPACNVPYSRTVIKAASYRDEPFLPLHPRSWMVHAFTSIPVDAFQRADGSWLQFCEDQAIFMPMLELYGQKCAVNSIPTSVYNQANQAADIKLHRLETLRDEIEIRRKPSYAPQGR